MLIDTQIEGRVGRNAARDMSPAATQKHSSRHALPVAQKSRRSKNVQCSALSIRVSPRSNPSQIHISAPNVAFVNFLFGPCRPSCLVVHELSHPNGLALTQGVSRQAHCSGHAHGQLVTIHVHSSCFSLASECNTARVDLGSRNDMCQRKAQLLTRSGLSLVICGAAGQHSCDFRGLHNTTNWKAAYPSDTQLFFASAGRHHSGSGLCIAWCNCSANFKSRFSS